MSTHDDQAHPSLESLLQEMIANQHSIHRDIQNIYEQLARLEQERAAQQAEDEQQSREQTVANCYEDAKLFVYEAGKASTSFLQRKLRVGYSVAVAIIDQLEEDGHIGSQHGAKPREIYLTEDDVERPLRCINCAANEFFQSEHTIAHGDDEDDDLYEDAKRAVIEANKASTSFLQRKLRVGYSRAARLMDLLEERGVVGPQSGARTTRPVIADAAPSTDPEEK